MISRTAIASKNYAAILSAGKQAGMFGARKKGVEGGGTFYFTDDYTGKD